MQTQAMKKLQMQLNRNYMQITDHPLWSILDTFTARTMLSFFSMSQDTLTENAYHNEEHCRGVAYLALEIYHHEYSEPTATDVMLLSEMALFHDARHLGGRAANDGENIKNAVAWVSRYYDGKHYDILKAGIESTEFPYAPDRKLTVLEACLRDADLLWATVKGCPEKIMDDLRFEMSVHENRVITHDEMLQRQLQFMAQLQTLLKTETGEILFEYFTPAFVLSLQDFAVLPEKPVSPIQTSQSKLEALKERARKEMRGDNLCKEVMLQTIPIDHHNV